MIAAIFIVGGFFIANKYSGQIYKALVSEKSRTQCYAMSDVDAKAMISRIFDEKLKQSNNGIILVDVNPKNIYASKVTHDNGKKGDGLNSTNVEYSDNATRQKVFTAVIYEDCDVQWSK